MAASRETSAPADDLIDEDVEAVRAEQIERREYRGKVFPSAVIGSLMAWSQDY